MKVMATTYRMTMSDGTPFQIRIDDAGKAIEAALRQFRGRTVILCYSGVTEEDCAQMEKEFPDEKPMPGTIRHEIPAHDPIPAEAVFPPIVARRDRFPDPGTTPLFGEYAE